MAGVLRIDNLDYRSSIGDIRRILKDYGAIPSDIHLGSQSSGKPNGTAFAIFPSRKEADQGLRADGIICRDSRIVIRGSNPKDFDKMFPGKPMLSHQKNNFNREDRLTGVVKVEHIDYSASPSDIRRFFKERDARPEDIHLVLQPNGNKHNGCAFLIFSVPSETVNALKLDGAIFRDKRITVKSSNPKEFDRFFPRVPMITKAKASARGRGGGRGGRGAGIGGRGSNNNSSMSRPNNNMDDRSQDRFNTTPRGRGRGMRGGGRGGGPGRGGGRFGTDQFFNGANDNSNVSRGRSRSPINRGRRDSPVRNFNGDSFDRRRPEPIRDNQRFEDPIPGINERKFLRVIGLPFDSSQVDIQNFFRPILTREIYMERNANGKYVGKFNGCAIVEFFSEGDARQAVKMDGRKFGHHIMAVSRTGKEEIRRTIEENKNTNDSSGPISTIPDFSALNNVAQSNPQVQHLLNLLTATVNTIAGAAAAASQPKSEKFRDNRGERPDRSRDDPVINRVASSANIDVSDIKLGRVVGVRNLPYTVTPDEILHFFRNYKVIPDSVRIHYLEDGRCSGDAIICFRGNRDARNAVSDLNKGIIGRRKVELFFL